MVTECGHTGPRAPMINSVSQIRFHFASFSKNNRQYLGKESVALTR